MEDAQLLNRLINLEKELDVNRIQVKGIPLWRIVRYSTRLHYLSCVSGYVASTGSAQTVGKKKIKFISGFWRYIGRDNLNVFFPFNRLVDKGNCLLDKFVDPVIEESELYKQHCVIVDSPNYRGSFNRIHKDICVQQENRTIYSQFLKQFFKLFVKLRYNKEIDKLFQIVKDPFLLNEGNKNSYYQSLSLFLAGYSYYLMWFRILKPRRVFVVLREGYFPVIAACKKLGIPVAEFQHGITLDKTVSYTGDYDERIDPDYFLTFGKFWKEKQFGMTSNRIFCIGWAYGKYLSKGVEKESFKRTNEILVISSPEISDSILDTLIVLSKVEGAYSFHIRLHPCESYNDKQKQKLQSIPNAQVVDNKTDSALVLPTYKYVVGENSSVIYEALSVGCKVGMLNLCGLKPAIDLPGIKENFFVINDAKDFERFLTEESTEATTKAEFYSEFDNKKFMEFINQKM